MAHHKSSIKRIRQTKKRNYYNRTNKKLVKKALRAVRESTTYEEASTNLRSAFSILDKVIYRGVFHKNTVANKKSSLAKFVKKLETA